MLPTPSQTVGPYFHIGLPYESVWGQREAAAQTRGLGAADRPQTGGPRLAPDGIRIGGRVFDGEGEVVDDAIVEIWQANAAGRYDHPEDDREDLPLTDGFRGFGRCGTDGDGRYEFATVKPGPVPHPDGGMQAPHIEVAVFARGLLKQVVTRIYFPDEAEANEADPVLASVDPDRRAALVAREDGDLLRFDIHLQGDRETPFFDV
jgi:protocatechuate 3,4-dioxygenase, alpha subunit